MNNFEVRDFDKEYDLNSISSFLKSRKEAHNLNYLDSIEWFKWKFLDSPNGSAIMPTVFNEDKIIGANYYGVYPLRRKQDNISAVLPYEAFVHQSGQGKGLFKKLIKSAEETAIDKDVQVMMSFPNKNSIQGFISSGWTYVPNSVKYWLKPIYNFKILINILDIKKPFQPNKSNGKNNFQFEDIKNFLYQDQLHGLWSKEYLNWRFNILPQAEYVYLKQNSFELVARIGHRGKLKETQIIFVDFKINRFNKKDFKRLVKSLAKKTEADLIGFPMSSHYPIYEKMKSFGFYKLPSGTQFCYKVLDDNLNKEELKFSLCGLDFHTY